MSYRYLLANDLKITIFIPQNSGIHKIDNILNIAKLIYDHPHNAKFTRGHITRHRDNFSKIAKISNLK
jgi:hypothetical protein